MIAAIHNIYKTYHDSDQLIEVLRGTSLEIEERDFICITGKSGSGKSTLLHILGLLDSPDSGDLEISGRKISSLMSDAALIRNRNLGFVFQFHYLVEDLTASENVALPLLIAGESATASLAQARELLIHLGLEQRLNRYPNQLSGGEQQRIALARALVNKPAMVLADEPTGNLDPGHSKDVWDLMYRLNSELGQAFVIVTHDVEAAAKAPKSFELAEGVLIPR
ncbi:MAG: ABC transporter ATP-binding protein [Candidatus Cloacimonetes bacterium]|nr:ABC transporter ATP-binding protein [Candidatus Cloacimonadota bacterium]MDY0336998.1 ABC transporter ATP-binding protein [Candidatus Cloacimonadaceae bacterium]MCB5269390.1 ABC transporter ATP-binding protein [Candidatus Cloacimonadota bacterium]MCK9334628.1 ABC transporter ATP-binding protein [Candidatus Cloacimonadota bacterium]MDD2543335.1 ABC transporter ATP-binding protein [Candidatus Cloacimonadota bacterium]